MPKPILNARQQKFAELVAGGMIATDAYISSGYKTSQRAAITNAARLMTNDAIQAEIERIRAKSTAESRKIATKTKAEKLARLEKIAWGKGAKPMNVIAAIKVHNEMTGDNAPLKTIQEDGPERIRSARERALQIASPLNLLANRSK